MCKNTGCLWLLLPFIIFSSVAQAGHHAVNILPAGSQPSFTGPPENFIGHVRVEPLFTADKIINASAAYVTFAPGARSAWHTHPAGQRLIVTSGVGLTQQEGQPVQVIRTGDVVICPPGVKHWHGAKPDSAMTHLAITGSLNGKSVNWLEKVTDEAQKPALNLLSPRQQAITLIAVFMATSSMEKLNRELNVGLDAGMTVNEAKEILVQLYAYTGFPRSLNALSELKKVVDHRKQQGITDIQGKEPVAAVPVGDDLRRLGIANQTKISGAPVQGPVFEFAPVINQFLQTHLFGDIFARDNLDWQSRELATVGALAATAGVEAQLLSHMRASLRVGLSAGQLQQLVDTLREQGEPDASARAEKALLQATQ